MQVYIYRTLYYWQEWAIQIMIKQPFKYQMHLQSTWMIASHHLSANTFKMATKMASVNYILTIDTKITPRLKSHLPLQVFLWHQLLLYV
jgi:hypothetical protein